MPRLPDVAWARMSPKAADNIAAKAPKIAPQPVNVFTSTASNETWTATAGADLFVFDASSFQGNDTIIGYDPLEDRIEIRNTWTFGYQGIEGVIEHFGLSQDGTYRSYSGSVAFGIDFAELDPHDSISIYKPGADVAFFVI